jgi:hypothetical protein
VWCNLFVAAGGNLAPSVDARRLVSESVLMQPVSEFCAEIFSNDAEQSNAYAKLSEASTVIGKHGVHPSHGDGHISDVRIGARRSLAGGRAHCGFMDFILPRAVCGRDDVIVSIPFWNGDVYIISNAIGHKNQSLIEHKVRPLYCCCCLRHSLEISSKRGAGVCSHQVPENRTGAVIIATMLDYKSKSRRAAKALTPAIGPSDYQGKFSGLEPAPARDIGSIAFKRIQLAPACSDRGPAAPQPCWQ